MRTPFRLLRISAAALLLTAATATAVTLTATTAPPAEAAVPVNPADYQQVTLARGEPEVGEPMSLAVLPDRSVLHTARNGTLRRTDAAGTTTVIGTIPVYTHDEEGLQGVGVDPGFATNRAIYLYYSPPLSTPAGDAPGNASDFSAWKGYLRLSRFTLNSDFSLNAASEREVLRVNTDRGLCCHVGGDIDFDAAGNLYLSTGDDTNPFASDGYSPIDESANRNPGYDARRSAGNSNDLRGKILRIKVAADGTYTVPSGNLFAPGTANTRPEIYAMGFRNPFRISVDKPTGTVWVGDYGPDAGSSSSSRGPSGQVEFDRVTAPGNFGWPYCTGTNTSAETYNQFTFPSGPSGAKFDCAGGPTNTSRWNTGIAKLPPAQPAWIRYGGDAGTPAEFGGGSESPMAGPVYRYDAANPSTTKFPSVWNGQFFATEFGRGWIKPIAVQSSGAPGEISSFPWTGKQVMDSAFGPDGSYYLLDYGTGYFNGDANSALYRFDYTAGANRAPTAVASANKTSGAAPLAVTFSSAGSSDPEGGALTYSWAFGDGTTSTAANPTKTYSTNGTYTATLTVRDTAGLTGTASVRITVGNTAPVVTITTPYNGQPFSFGDTVPYTVSVSDPEDGTIDCTKVTLTYVLGHDQHGHQITSKQGCSGSITVPTDGEHDDAANIFAIFDASYTDKGGLIGTTQVKLQPRHRQAEHFSSQVGVGIIDHAGAEGGKTVGNIENGDSITLTPYRLDAVTGITARVSSAGAGGTIQVRAGSATGTVLGTLTVPVTGGWETFTTVTSALTRGPAATTSLTLTFAGGSGALFDVDSFTLQTGTTGGGSGRIVGLAGKCLDVRNAATADGTQIQLYTCNGTAAQTWTRDGQTLRSLGKCLDVNGGGSADGTKIQLWTCNGSGAQNWAPNSDGTLRNPQSGKCLDVSGNNPADSTPVHLWTCIAGAANQKWTLS
jgi:glucose/arabinose dehydrogenase/PKD repeat protein